MIIRGCTRQIYNTVEQGCKYNSEESFSQFSICSIPGAHNDNEEKEGKEHELPMRKIKNFSSLGYEAKKGAKL